MAVHPLRYKKEFGPCIVCRQQLSAPRNIAWRIDGDFILGKEDEPLEGDREVQEDVGSEVFHIDCSRCKSSSFVIIVPGPFHAKAVIQTLTDLTKQDLARIPELREINSDEILGFYSDFRKFEH